MNPVIVKNIRIGEGIPKICVPVVGVTAEEIRKEAEALLSIPADLVEWRADWYEGVFDVAKVKEVLRNLRCALGEKPILFTFRTSGEGGEKSIAEADYLALNREVAESRLADLIDAELFMGDGLVKELIETAHQNGVKVIASNHDFQKTPEKEEIVSRLRKMQEHGADILKIAVMPQEKKDVLTLLAATEEMIRLFAKQPVITMSMAEMGVISRIAGEAFGSAVTFGSAKKSSAPGQLPAGELSKVLKVLHRA